MSLINDVKYELGKLNLSVNQLRKFGITFGFLFFMLSIFFYLKAKTIFLPVFILLLGIVFILSAFILPEKLKLIYKYWMGLAFFLGWFVSRVILTILFIFVITPIGIILKLFNKPFLNLDFPVKGKTNWAAKNNSDSKIEKMY